MRGPSSRTSIATIAPDGGFSSTITLALSHPALNRPKSRRSPSISVSGYFLIVRTAQAETGSQKQISTIPAFASN
jgi:hypothetical protein